MERCEKSPNGYHCKHDGGMMSWPAAPKRCCWCGESGEKHGPFAPGRSWQGGQWGESPSITSGEHWERLK